jgi:hypothetical protein
VGTVLTRSEASRGTDGKHELNTVLYLPQRWGRRYDPRLGCATDGGIPTAVLYINLFSDQASRRGGLKLTDEHVSSVLWLTAHPDDVSIDRTFFAPSQLTAAQRTACDVNACIGKTWFTTAGPNNRSWLTMSTYQWHPPSFTPRMRHAFD